VLTVLWKRKVIDASAMKSIRLRDKQHEAAILFGFEERCYLVRAAAQSKPGSRSGAVANAQPDYFRWASGKNTALREIRVFGDNCKFILQGKTPDLVVWGAEQSTVFNMG